MQGRPHVGVGLSQDPVHGLIRLDGKCFDIVDSQPFQRLRELRQLGTTQCVYNFTQCVSG